MSLQAIKVSTPFRVAEENPLILSASEYLLIWIACFWKAILVTVEQKVTMWEILVRLERQTSITAVTLVMFVGMVESY